MLIDQDTKSATKTESDNFASDSVRGSFINSMIKEKHISPTREAISYNPYNYVLTTNTQQHFR